MFMLVASCCAHIEGVGIVCEDTQVDALNPIEKCASMIVPFANLIQRDLAEKGVPLVSIAVGCMPQAEA